MLSVIPKKELIDLTNDDPCNSSEIDTTCFASVSLISDSLIDGYLRARYELPLKVTPLFIKQIAIDICAYRLYIRRPHKIPDHIQKNYEIAIKNLQDIKKGNILLEDETENPETEIPPVKTTIRINKRSDDRIFSDNVMRCFFKR